MLLPPPAPKQEAKYTGFMLATEKRAHERMLQEKEKERELAMLEAAEAGDPAAVAAIQAAGVKLTYGLTMWVRGLERERERAGGSNRTQATRSSM